MKMQCQRKQIDYTYVHTNLKSVASRLGAVSLVYMLYMTSKKTTM